MKILAVVGLTFLSGQALAEIMPQKEMRNVRTKRCHAFAATSDRRKRP